MSGSPFRNTGQKYENGTERGARLLTFMTKPLDLITKWWVLLIRLNRFCLSVFLLRTSDELMWGITHRSVCRRLSFVPSRLLRGGRKQRTEQRVQSPLLGMIGQNRLPA